MNDELVVILMLLISLGVTYLVGGFVGTGDDQGSPPTPP